VPLFVTGSGSPSPSTLSTTWHPPPADLHYPRRCAPLRLFKIHRLPPTSIFFLRAPFLPPPHRDSSPPRPLTTCPSQSPERRWFPTKLESPPPPFPHLSELHPCSLLYFDRTTPHLPLYTPVLQEVTTAAEGHWSVAAIEEPRHAASSPPATVDNPLR
jgi:hypothetical protein